MRVYACCKLAARRPCGRHAHMLRQPEVLKEGPTMARFTRTIAPYKSDILGLLFEVSEPSEYVAEVPRGWAINAFPAGFTPPLPKPFAPRPLLPPPPPSDPRLP